MKVVKMRILRKICELIRRDISGRRHWGQGRNNLSGGQDEGDDTKIDGSDMESGDAEL